MGWMVSFDDVLHAYACYFSFFFFFLIIPWTNTCRPSPFILIYRVDACISGGRGTICKLLL